MSDDEFDFDAVEVTEIGAATTLDPVAEAPTLFNDAEDAPVVVPGNIVRSYADLSKDELIAELNKRDKAASSAASNTEKLLAAKAAKAKARRDDNGIDDMDPRGAGEFEAFAEAIHKKLSRYLVPRQKEADLKAGAKKADYTTTKLLLSKIAVRMCNEYDWVTLEKFRQKVEQWAKKIELQVEQEKKHDLSKEVGSDEEYEDEYDSYSSKFDKY